MSGGTVEFNVITNSGMVHSEWSMSVLEFYSSKSLVSNGNGLLWTFQAMIRKLSIIKGCINEKDGKPRDSRTDDRSKDGLW